MYMLELCQILDISVNELLTGEFIEERNYQQKAEDNLLMMANQEVKQTKKMFFYENVIGIGSTSIFLILIKSRLVYLKFYLFDYWCINCFKNRNRRRLL